MVAFKAKFLYMLAVRALQAQAQQLDGIIRGVDYPGLSDRCVQALNTTVTSCPAFLSGVALDNPRLNSAQLSALCTTACRDSLNRVRGVIATACNAVNDTMEFDGVVYPATLIVDRFRYTFDLSCRKDTSSARYCDELFFSWLASGNASTSAAKCSDCSLGVVQVQLNSPFGFSEEFAQQFQSTKASCGSSGYSFTTPTPYAISTKLPNPADDTSQPSCSNPYVVKSGDSCDTIALARKVSTHSIIKAGGLKNDCSNLLPGTSLCLPAPCTLHRVQEGDSCTSIVKANSGVTGVSFLAWNPNITPLCNNLADFTRTLICVSPPGGSASDITITVAPPASTTANATPTPKPMNGASNTTMPCAKWYTVQDGDYCESISIRQNIALQDFFFLNPSVDTKCLNLWLSTAYCVLPVGDINKYPGYPYSSSAIYSLTKSAYVTTTSELKPVVPSPTARVALPRAPGTKSDCEVYVDTLPVDPFRDQSESENVRLITESVNSCDFASSIYPISYDDFIKWNPSLASIKPCFLQQNYSYCAVSSVAAYPDNPSYGFCLAVDDAYPGTISTCDCFTIVKGSSAQTLRCAKLASDANITLSEFTRYNPWVGSDCDAGLFKGLSTSDQRAVCIGVNATDVQPSTTGAITPTRTATPTRTSAVPTSSKPVAPPAQTQAGIPASCRAYYVAKQGDGCWAISNQYGITLDQFYAWNPAVGTSCGALWPDYAYCVAA